MPSTTVHIPDRLLSKIDQVAREKGLSRNRFIVQACQKALDNEAGEWPESFFEPQMDEEDLRLLRETVSEMEEAIISRRRNRKKIDL